jgi:uncharacterized protein
VRYLLIVAVIIVAVLLWRRALRRDLPPPDQPDRPTQDPAGEAMVQCRVCGVFLPQQESLKEGPFHYCSEAHRQQDRSA